MIKKILEYKSSVFYASVISIFIELAILAYGINNPDQVGLLFPLFLFGMFLPAVILIFHKEKSIEVPDWLK